MNHAGGRRVLHALSWLGGVAMLLAACGQAVLPTLESTAAPDVATAAPTVAPVALPTVTPTDAPAATALPAGVDDSTRVAPNADWTVNAFVEGDYFVLGNPDAPIRLLDYSDFL